MKITRIELYRRDLPYSGGVYTLSEAGIPQLRCSFVRIVTDSGLDGWGESTPFGSTYIASHALGARAGIAEIAPSLLGRDPRQVDRINEAMDEALLGHNHAKSADRGRHVDVRKAQRRSRYRDAGGKARLVHSFAERPVGT